MSMDIYVLSDPVMIILRLLFKNIIGLPTPVCIGLFFILSLILAYLISALVIRRVKIFRFLFLGMCDFSKAQNTTFSGNSVKQHQQK